MKFIDKFNYRHDWYDNYSKFRTQNNYYTIKIKNDEYQNGVDYTSIIGDTRTDPEFGDLLVENSEGEIYIKKYNLGKLEVILGKIADGTYYTYDNKILNITYDYYTEDNEKIHGFCIIPKRYTNTGKNVWFAVDLWQKQWFNNDFDINSLINQYFEQWYSYYDSTDLIMYGGPFEGNTHQFDFYNINYNILPISSDEFQKPENRVVVPTYHFISPNLSDDIWSMNSGYLTTDAKYTLQPNFMDQLQYEKRIYNNALSYTYYIPESTDSNFSGVASLYEPWGNLYEDEENYYGIINETLYNIHTDVIDTPAKISQVYNREYASNLDNNYFEKNNLYGGDMNENNIVTLNELLNKQFPTENFKFTYYIPTICELTIFIIYRELINIMLGIHEHIAEGLAEATIAMGHRTNYNQILIPSCSPSPIHKFSVLSIYTENGMPYLCSTAADELFNDQDATGSFYENSGEIILFFQY